MGVHPALVPSRCYGSGRQSLNHPPTHTHQPPPPRCECFPSACQDSSPDRPLQSALHPSTACPRGLKSACHFRFILFIRSSFFLGVLLRGFGVVIPPPHSGPSHSDIDLFFKFRAWIDNGGDCVSVHSVCGTLLELNRGPRKNKTDNIGQLLLKVAVGGNH